VPDDPRIERLATVVARIEGAACWLARTATRAAAPAGVAGVVLWWTLAGERLTDWWKGTATSLVVLILCLAPAGWLLNVRAALHDLVDLPANLQGVATRRRAPQKPADGVLGAIRTVRGIARDYGDVTGAWGTVAQLVVPSFWLLTALAFAAVPVLVVVAAVAALLDAGG
jgi:hypothetical protein